MEPSFEQRKQLRETELQSLRRQLSDSQSLLQSALARNQRLEWQLEDAQSELKVLRKRRSETEEMLRREIRKLEKWS